MRVGWVDWTVGVTIRLLRWTLIEVELLLRLWRCTARNNGWSREEEV